MSHRVLVYADPKAPGKGDVEAIEIPDTPNELTEGDDDYDEYK